MTVSLTTADLADLALSAAMKEGSAVEHDEAEHSAFMDELLGGRINAAGYADYLRALRRVYATLETLGRALSDDPVSGPVIDAGLDRLAAIDADLDFWAPGETHESDSEAAASYAAAIAASAVWGGLYLAHHYTRYLGDLSGGQFIGKLMARQFELGSNGIGFYVFDEIADPAAFKDVYREQLDAAPWDATEAERVIDEVLLAYQLNTDLFVDLAAAKAAASAADTATVA